MPKTLDEIEKLLSDLGAGLVTLKEELTALINSKAKPDDIKALGSKLDAWEKRVADLEGKLKPPPTPPAPEDTGPSAGFYDPRLWD